LRVFQEHQDVVRQQLKSMIDQFNLLKRDVNIRLDDPRKPIDARPQQSLDIRPAFPETMSPGMIRDRGQSLRMKVKMDENIFEFVV